jgi:hypothetical protein
MLRAPAGTYEENATIEPYSRSVSDSIDDGVVLRPGPLCDLGKTGFRAEWHQSVSCGGAEPVTKPRTESRLGSMISPSLPPRPPQRSRPITASGRRPLAPDL